VGFGDILDKWERQYAGNVVYDKDAVLSGDIASSRKRNANGSRRHRLLRKKAEASIDLHGLNIHEAWIALDAFFGNSRTNGFEKVLIIHGKGNHSNEAALKDLSKRFIESCPFAGESGYSSAREGGRGATWVILKEANVPGKLFGPC
jgi:DNA-nicking Smr family endonuclease